MGQQRGIPAGDVSERISWVEPRVCMDTGTHSRIRRDTDNSGIACQEQVARAWREVQNLHVHCRWCVCVAMAGVADLVFGSEELHASRSDVIAISGLVPVDKGDLCGRSCGVVLEEQWALIVASAGNPCPAAAMNSEYGLVQTPLVIRAMGMITLVRVSTAQECMGGSAGHCSAGHCMPPHGNL